MFIPAWALPAYTVIHVVISLVTALSGCVVLYGMVKNTQLRLWRIVFLVSATLTSVTGFGFPISRLTPGIVIGIISLIAIASALYALRILTSSARGPIIYTICVLFVFYSNSLILMVQSFQKIGPLHNLAPNQTELPFLISQMTLLGSVVAAGVFAVRNIPSNR